MRPATFAAFLFGVAAGVAFAMGNYGEQGDLAAIKLRACESGRAADAEARQSTCARELAACHDANERNAQVFGIELAEQRGCRHLLDMLRVPVTGRVGR